MSPPQRRLFGRFNLPQREQIFSSRWSRPFAPLFDKPYFWTLNRRQAALSVAIGLFCGLMPGPSQMMSALIIAYFSRTNLPVALFTTLYTNPLTYMPLYYLAYRIGSWILGTPVTESLNFPTWNHHFWQELGTWLLGTGKPLLLGVPVLGSCLALIGYIAVLSIWRIHTSLRWQQRKEQRHG